MKIKCFLVLFIYAQSAFAFSFPAQARGLLDINENCQRDVYRMSDWANNCGVQKADGFELESYDGQDYEVITQQDLPVGSPILYVPNEMVFASYKAAEEFGGALAEPENLLISTNLQHKIPLFRVFVKILTEYEKGESSSWFPWLNSTPRLYNTGASMTYACFECLPPYAAGLALSERQYFIKFQKAIKVSADILLTEDTVRDVNLLKWAYNVAVTRSIEWNGERLIAPMADMFNHGTETEVDITYDEEGNCMAYTSRDVPAGSPLRISLGDPTNPSPLFATYGFLDESSPATFCKVMHLEEEMIELGYTFSNLLFYKDTGDISTEVYDVVLYGVLKKNDPGLAQQFSQAVINGNEATKSQFQEQYWSYTKEALQEHVNGFLNDLEKLSAKALTYDPTTHPRVPVILKHNGFVKETFLKVKQNLDNM
jgi:hypothetical protein